MSLIPFDELYLWQIQVKFFMERYNLLKAENNPANDAISVIGYANAVQKYIEPINGQ